MKNYSLAFQIWITFATSVIIILFILGIVYTNTVRNFFENETYEIILTAQENFAQNILNRPFMRMFRSEMALINQEMRSVHHIIFIENDSVEIYYKTGKENDLDSKTIEIMNEMILNQQKKILNYSIESQDKKLFFTARKVFVQNISGYLVSYMWDTYKKQVEKSLLVSFFFGGAISIFVILIISLLLAKNLTKPLKKLKKSVQSISKKEWYNSVKINRKDEIGELANSIEKMRTDLINSDKTEREFIQYASHELKTPLMVIRSYIQAIEDGIFPNGTLEGTLKVIEEESSILEKRIYDLLYYSKIDYLFRHEKGSDLIDIKEIFEKSFRKRAIIEKIELDINFININLKAVEEHWKIIFDNIFDNHFRYAKNKISVNSYYDEINYYIEIINDGSLIDEKVLENMFKPYNKGVNGKTGLGIVIVQKILNIYNGILEISNLDDGVKYLIIIKR